VYVQLLLDWLPGREWRAWSTSWRIESYPNKPSSGEACPIARTEAGFRALNQALEDSAERGAARIPVHRTGPTMRPADAKGGFMGWRSGMGVLNGGACRRTRTSRAGPPMSGSVSH
jgi:hypothetical protein